MPQAFVMGTPVLLVDAVDPTANDDRADGIKRGFLWHNTTTDVLWFCISPEPAGSARWIPVGSGEDIIATGITSIAIGGEDNEANGTQSVVLGGARNVADGLRAVLLGGIDNVASGDDTIVLGGKGNIASANNSAALGALAQAYIMGQIAWSAGGASGSLLQRSSIPIYVDVSSTTPAELDAGTALTLPNDTTWRFTGSAVARRLDADGENGGWSFSGVIKRDANAASTALLVAVTPTKDTNTPAAWALTVTADTSAGSLSIKFTGEAGKTIRCACDLNLIELTG